MIKPDNPNSEFELGGINHVALVCSDMERTVDFYSNVLGMPLIKSLDLPGGMGQHFFFDSGNGDCVAFFCFSEAPDRVPGLSFRLSCRVDDLLRRHVPTIPPGCAAYGDRLAFGP